MKKSRKLKLYQILSFIVFICIFVSFKSYGCSQHTLLENNKKFIEKERIIDKKLKNLISEYQTSSSAVFEIFTLEKARKIKNTKLYKIIHTMPKGANLHLHSCASIYTIFDFCYENPNVYIVPNKDNSYEECQLYVANCALEVPNGFILFKEAIDRGILSKKKVLSSWSMDSYESKNNVWPEFQSIFKKVDALGRAEITFKDFYKMVFLECIKDNVYHLEIRFHPLNFKNELTQDKTKSLRLLREVYYEIKKDYPNFTLKVILARSKNKENDLDFENFVLTATNLKDEIKDEFDPNNVSNFIVGFDLVGKDIKNRLKNYVAKVNDLRAKGINVIDSYLHAGETNDISNDSILDAYKIRSKRIGHGTNLYAFPELAKKFKEEKICLEVCPISNQILKLTIDLKMHPAYQYFKCGIPISICSDNQMMFGTEGLSFDFFEIINAWNLNLSDIKKLIINSIKYSALSEYEKNKALINWEIEWKKFINDQFEKNF